MCLYKKNLMDISMTVITKIYKNISKNQLDTRYLFHLFPLIPSLVATISPNSPSPFLPAMPMYLSICPTPHPRVLMWPATSIVVRGKLPPLVTHLRYENGTRNRATGMVTIPATLPFDDPRCPEKCPRNQGKAEF